MAHRDAAVREMLITQQANEALQEQLLHSAHDTEMRDERARLPGNCTTRWPRDW